MRKIIILTILLLIFVLSGFKGSYADFDPNLVGSARAVGEGGAFTAVIDNNNSIFYNPAAVEFKSEQNYLAGYKQGIDSTAGYIFSFTKKLTENDLIGFGVDNIYAFDVSNGLMVLSYARKLNNQYILGASFKRRYLSSPAFSGDSFSGNLGFAYKMNENISFGLTIENLIKTNLKTGVNSEEVIVPTVSFGISYYSESPMLERLDVDMTYGQDQHFRSLRLGGGIAIKLFGLSIWKGYSYLDEQVVPASYYYKYHLSSRAGRWEEAIGIGVPVSDDLIVECTSVQSGSNIISVRCKI